MVNAMKLVSSLTRGNYSKDFLRFPRKLIIFSLIIFIIVFILVVFKISFNCRINYLIEKIDNNLYQVIVPYHDLDVWSEKDKIYYQKDSYSYSVEEIGKDSIFQNNTVYLQILIKIDKLSNLAPLIEVSLEDNNITIWNYLNKKIRGK